MPRKGNYMDSRTFSHSSPAGESAATAIGAETAAVEDEPSSLLDEGNDATNADDAPQSMMPLSPKQTTVAAVGSAVTLTSLVASFFAEHSFVFYLIAACAVVFACLIFLWYREHQKCSILREQNLSLIQTAQQPLRCARPRSSASTASSSSVVDNDNDDDDLPIVCRRPRTAKSGTTRPLSSPPASPPPQPQPSSSPSSPTDDPVTGAADGTVDDDNSAGVTRVTSPLPSQPSTEEDNTNSFVPLSDETDPNYDPALQSIQPAVYAPSLDTSAMELLATVATERLASASSPTQQQTSSEETSLSPSSTTATTTTASSTRGATKRGRGRPRKPAATKQ